MDISKKKPKPEKKKNILNLVPSSENIFQQIISAEIFTSNYLPEISIAMILIA